MKEYDGIRKTARRARSKSKFENFSSEIFNNYTENDILDIESEMSSPLDGLHKAVKQLTDLDVTGHEQLQKMLKDMQADIEIKHILDKDNITGKSYDYVITDIIKGLFVDKDKEIKILNERLDKLENIINDSIEKEKERVYI